MFWSLHNCALQSAQFCFAGCTIVNSTFVDFPNLWLAAPIVNLTLALEGSLKASAHWRTVHCVLIVWTELCAHCMHCTVEGSYLEAAFAFAGFSRNRGNDQKSPEKDEKALEEEVSVHRREMHQNSVPV